MKLWIRSQENGLSEIVDILPVKEAAVYGYSVNHRLVFLGEYATKERALEVLDEIQELLMPKVKIIHNKIEETKLQDFTSDVIIQPMIEDIQVQQAICYVYQMPKE